MAASSSKSPPPLSGPPPPSKWRLWGGTAVQKSITISDRISVYANAASSKVGGERFWPSSNDMPLEIEKCERILRQFTVEGIPDKQAKEEEVVDEKGVKKIKKRKVLKKIPPKVIKQAKGIVIYTSMRSGIAPFGGSGGTGLVLARLPSGAWSAPSACSPNNVSAGLLLGLDILNVILILNTDVAVESFKTHKFTLGAETAVVAGPIGAGISAEAGWERAPIFSYVVSRGLYAGVEIMGQVFVDRFDENERFYHWPGIKAGDILSGKIKNIPNVVVPLHRALRDAETGVAQGGKLEKTVYDMIQMPTNSVLTLLPGREVKRKMPPLAIPQNAEGDGEGAIATSQASQDGVEEDDDDDFVREGERLHLPPTPEELEALERAGIPDEEDLKWERKEREAVYELPPPPVHRDVRKKWEERKDGKVRPSSKLLMDNWGSGRGSTEGRPAPSALEGVMLNNDKLSDSPVATLPDLSLGKEIEGSSLTLPDEPTNNTSAETTPRTTTMDLLLDDEEGITPPISQLDALRLGSDTSSPHEKVGGSTEEVNDAGVLAAQPAKEADAATPQHASTHLPNVHAIEPATDVQEDHKEDVAVPIPREAVPDVSTEVSEAQIPSEDIPGDVNAEQGQAVSKEADEPEHETPEVTAPKDVGPEVTQNSVADTEVAEDDEGAVVIADVASNEKSATEPLELNEDHLAIPTASASDATASDGVDMRRPSTVSLSVTQPDSEAATPSFMDADSHGALTPASVYDEDARSVAGTEDEFVDAGEEDEDEEGEQKLEIREAKAAANEDGEGAEEQAAPAATGATDGDDADKPAVVSPNRAPRARKLPPSLDVSTAELAASVGSPSLATGNSTPSSTAPGTPTPGNVDLVGERGSTPTTTERGSSVSSTQDVLSSPPARPPRAKRRGKGGNK